MPPAAILRPRIGVLSFAHYHANFWCEAFNADEQAELAGIWDADVERGEEAAQRFETTFYPDFDALLAVSDAVAVCSETFNHAPHVERAAQAGRHVLCEKPMAESLASAVRLRSAVHTHGICYMQSFPKRFDPISHELKQLVDTSALGRIHMVRIRHGHFYGLDADFHTRWYVDPAKGGGGALLDEGVHAADLLCWLFGPPDTVVAMTSSATTGLKVEDTAIALFSYDDGLIAEIASSFVFQAADASIEIFGDAGTAIVSGVDLASRDITDSAFLKVYRSSESPKRWELPEIVPRFKLGEFHHQNAWQFARCLREGVPPPMGVAEGISALAMIEAAYTAARTGKREPVVIPPAADSADGEGV